MAKTIKGGLLANKFMPPSITLKEEGAEVKQSGLLKAKTVFFPYAHTNLSVASPLIGRSTLTFNMDRVIVSVKGFKKKEAEEIKAVFNAGFYEK